MNEKLHSFPFTDDPVFDIRLCGTSYCDGSYRIDRKRSQVHNFEYIISGGGTVVTPQGTFHPLAGDLYFLPAGEDHLYYSDAEEPWVKIWFNVTGGLAETLARQYGVADTRLFRGCPAEALFEEFIATVDGGADAETVKRRCAVVMHRVIQLMADSAKDGGCSEDAAALRGVHDQYMLGEALLVKPVTKPIADGGDATEVLLPPGGWYDWFTLEYRAGGSTQRIETPLERFPVLVRAGSVLPVAEGAQCAADLPTPARELMVFGGADGTLEWYDDSGDGDAPGLRIPVRYDDATATLTLGDCDGALPEPVAIAARLFRPDGSRRTASVRYAGAQVRVAFDG